MTTRAIGEEDTNAFRPTTAAVGEEDGGIRPIATTRALGEDGNFPEGGFRPTTLAVGEEDGGGRLPNPPTAGIVGMPQKNPDRLGQEQNISPEVKADPSKYAQAIVGQQVSTPTLAPGTSVADRLVLQQETPGTRQQDISVAGGTAVSPTGVTAQATQVSPDGTVI